MLSTQRFGVSNVDFCFQVHDQWLKNFADAVRKSIGAEHEKERSQLTSKLDRYKTIIDETVRIHLCPTQKVIINRTFGVTVVYSDCEKMVSCNGNRSVNIILNTISFNPYELISEIKAEIRFSSGPSSFD